jgi:hypothetical protein
MGRITPHDGFEIAVLYKQLKRARRRRRQAEERVRVLEQILLRHIARKALRKARRRGGAA